MSSYGTFKASNFRYLTGQKLDAGAVPSSFVGGTVTNNEILTDSTLVGTASGRCAAAQGASVMVQRSGVVQVLTDTSAIVVGSLLSPSAATSGSAALGSTAGF